MACRAVLTTLRGCSVNNLKPMLTYCQLFQWNVRCASGAVGATKAAKGAAVSKKKELEVETDAKVLCSRLCGGNIYKEGEDPVLGPDSDYPDWLWQLRTDREPIPLEELTKDNPLYWRKLKIVTMKHNNKMKKHKPHK